MTRYEQGFMRKCAEYGLDADTSMQLMKGAQLAPKQVAKLLFRNFAKTNGKGLDKIIDRADSAYSHLDLLGALSDKTGKNLRQIAAIGRDVKSVVGKPGEEIGNLSNLSARLRDRLKNKIYPTKPEGYARSSETPLGRIYQALGFKNVTPKGTVATVRPS